MSDVITVWGGTEANPLSAVYSQPSGAPIYPPNVTPGNGNTAGGTGLGPGGFGVGDGGFSTSSDTTITKPTITFPNSGDNQDISDADTSTSSVFAATSGRTHVASRWIIYYVGTSSDVENDTAQPTIVFDSGATTVNLTSLPFTNIDFQHSSFYKIMVRYKASTTLTWSAWSEQQQFSTNACTPTAYVNWDASVASSITFGTGVNVDAWADRGSAGKNLTVYTAWTANKPDWMTNRFALGAVNITGKEGFTLSSALTPVSGKLTVFMVMYWNHPGSGSDSLLALTSSDNIGVTGGWYMGVEGIASNGDEGDINCGNVPGTPQCYSGVDSVPNGKHIIEMLIDSSATTKVILDGVQKNATTSSAYTGMTASYLGGQAGNYIANDHQLAECLVYNVALTEGQRSEERLRLATKWGVTLP